MQLQTPQQRNELYKNALFMFESNEYIRGLCYLFKHFDISDISILPEIEKHRPIFAGSNTSEWRVLGYWFDLSIKGKQRRIEILKQAIKETSK